MKIRMPPANLRRDQEPPRVAAEEAEKRQKRSSQQSHARQQPYMYSPTVWNSARATTTGRLVLQAMLTSRPRHAAVCVSGRPRAHIPANHHACPACRKTALLTPQPRATPQTNRPSPHARAESHQPANPTCAHPPRNHPHTDPPPIPERWADETPRNETGSRPPGTPPPLDCRAHATQTTRGRPRRHVSKNSARSPGTFAGRRKCGSRRRLIYAGNPHPPQLFV